MKKNIVFLSAALLLLLAQACGVFKGNKSMDEKSASNIYDKTWKLVELNGKTVPDKINGREPFITFDAESRRYSASGGCNGLGGTFVVKENKLEFSQGMSTMMACADMSVEDGFKKIFGTTLQYDLQNDGEKEILALSDGKTVVAKFSTNPSAASEKLSGTWELDYISGVRIALEGLYPDKKPTIHFDLENGQISGSGSCNNYNAVIELNNYNINIGSIASTKMMCPHIQGEDTFFQTLQKINKFSVNENQLTLIMSDIAMMRFKKI